MVMSSVLVCWYQTSSVYEQYVSCLLWPNNGFTVVVTAKRIQASTIQDDGSGLIVSKSGDMRVTLHMISPRKI